MNSGFKPPPRRGEGWGGVCEKPELLVAHQTYGEAANVRSCSHPTSLYFPMRTHWWRQLLWPLCATAIGFAVLAGNASGGRHSTVEWVRAVAPAAAALTLLAWCLALALNLRRQDRFERAGRCRSCGYDRQGLDITQPCPEWGRSGIQ